MNIREILDNNDIVRIDDRVSATSPNLARLANPELIGGDYNRVGSCVTPYQS